VVNLLVQDVPDKVAELKVTNVTSSTISLRWQLGFTGNSPVTSYLVQYQSDDPLDDLLMSMAKGAGSGMSTTSGQSSLSEPPTTQSSAVSDLSPARLYHHLFGFMADKQEQDKQQEQQQQQQQQQQQTKQQQQQASSIKAALEALNSLSSSLGGDLSITTADEIIDRTLVELTVEQTATSLVIKDLSPFCVYRLRLAGINKIGLGEFSDWIRAKTEEAPPSGSALKISATATGPNSIKLTWFPPDRRTWNGQLVRFQIGYRPLDSSYEFNKSVAWTPPTLMQSIMLDVDKKQRPADEGRSEPADAAKLKPPDTDAETAGNSSTTTTTSRPSALGRQGADSSPYALRQHLKQLLAMQQQELVAHLTNLQRSTTYLVWIQAINGRGMGPPSHAISVKTLDDVPPSAPALRIQSTTTSSITIAWSMLSNFISPANQYSLFYRRVPPPPTSPANGRQQQQQQQLFYPSGQPVAQRPSNASVLMATHHQAPLAGDSLAVFSEPGPFIERTLTSQQLLHALDQQNGLFQLDGPQQHHQADGHQQQQQQLQLQLARQLNGGFPHQQQAHYQQFVYTIEGLECGSVYELYMTTRNSVGKSEPSATVTTRTLGEPPLAPRNKNNLFARIGAQDVLLNLASWSTGGCPLTHVTIRYKQIPQPVSAASATGLGDALEQPGGSLFAQQMEPGGAKAHPSFSVAWPISTSVPANLLQAINQNLLHSPSSSVASSSGSSSGSQAHLVSAGGRFPQPSLASGAGDEPGTSDGQQQAKFALKNLQPSTPYELEIVAHNEAGHTTAQYEFVTAGLNGSRSGYTRREGVYRLDQRGQPIETAGGGGDQQPAGPSSAFAADHQNGAGHQSAGPVPVIQQLLPLVLTLLCLLSLIISSTFCYHRLAHTWKQRTRRNSIDGMRSICSGINGASGSGSDESRLAAGASKSATLQNWSRSSVGGGGGGNGHSLASRCPKDHNHHHLHHQQLQHQQQRRRLHSELVDEHSPSSINTSDSPPNDSQGFHYCLREPLGHHPVDDQQQQQQVMSATLNPKSSSFTQSVSMSDFNMVGAACGAPAATLNIKNGRAMGQQRLKAPVGAGAAGAGGVLASEFAKIGATIARGRLLEAAAHIPLTETYGNALAAGHRICSNYGSAGGMCKPKPDQIYGRQQQQQVADAVYGLNGSNGNGSNGNGSGNTDNHQTCNYPDTAQSHETSWTTSATMNGDHQVQHANGATNYAIPATFQMEQAISGGDQEPMPYPCDDLYGQGTIDACIQHLMSQQYQQEQQQQATAGRQQQYAVLVGGQTTRQPNEPANQHQAQNRCNIYGESVGAGPFVESHPIGATLNPANAQQTFDYNQQQQQRSIASYAVGRTAQAQSVIESSSSSSGIGVDSLGTPNNLDCASIVTSTAANNLANNLTAPNQNQSYAQQAITARNSGQPSEQQQQVPAADLNCN
jgi:hypothetical protein